MRERESLGDRDLTPQIKWISIKKTIPGSFKSRLNLCLEEKISLIRYKFTSQQLNKCKELIFRCHHKNRFELIWKRLIIKKNYSNNNNRIKLEKQYSEYELYKSIKKLNKD